MLKNFPPSGIAIGDVVKFTWNRNLTITANEMKKVLMLSAAYHWDNLMLGLLEEGDGYRPEVLTTRDSGFTIGLPAPDGADEKWNGVFYYPVELLEHAQ